HSTSRGEGVFPFQLTDDRDAGPRQIRAAPRAKSGARRVRVNSSIARAVYSPRRGGEAPLRAQADAARCVNWTAVCGATPDRCRRVATQWCRHRVFLRGEGRGRVSDNFWTLLSPALVRPNRLSSWCGKGT